MKAFPWLQGPPYSLHSGPPHFPPHQLSLAWLSIVLTSQAYSHLCSLAYTVPISRNVLAQESGIGVPSVLFQRALPRLLSEHHLTAFSFLV